METIPEGIKPFDQEANHSHLFLLSNLGITELKIHSPHNCMMRTETTLTEPLHG
jgi:hypothetical protein